MTRATSTRVAGPPAGVVEVWTVPLDVTDLAHEALTAALDADERRQAERMRVGGREWAAAHGALRLILGNYLGKPAASLRFTHADSGKPRLAGVKSLEFSFARSESLAMLAVASDREVGVDVERENDDTDIAAVAREFLPALDTAAIEAEAPELRRRAFFAAWARHEARLKLRGRGLDVYANDAEFDPGSFIVVRALTPRPGFAAAVAAEGGSWTVITREFSAPVSGA